MTKRGEKLVGGDEEQLHEQLRTERDPKATKRLVAALEYKSGLSPAKIQHKYGWHKQTVYPNQAFDGRTPVEELLN